MSLSTMPVFRDPARVRREVRRWRADGERVAFVPTMGALHEGHLSLLRRAKTHAERVVISVFVNPTQFGAGEDFDKYPRTLAQDVRLAREEGVDLCFSPRATTMYSAGERTRVHVTGLDAVMEGASRPDHFAGVALVVTKLLNVVEPDVLILGQKDAQQVVILERLIKDLLFPVKVVRGPIVRERDGLAMSSRNRRLNAPQRAAAPVLYRALRAARTAIKGGERSAARVLTIIRRTVATERLVRLDYAAVVDGSTLEPLRRLRGQVIIPVAAFVGEVRLIDNLRIRIPTETPK